MAGEAVTGSGPQPPDYLDATYDMFLSSISGERAESQRFSAWLDDVERDDMLPFEAARSGAQRTRVLLRRTTGETFDDVVNMSSYNYLGYGYHPEVIAAAKAALDQYGLGAASSPVHGGTFDLHNQLEAELLDFYGLPDRGAALFSSGYGVNTGVVSALMRRRHHVVLDRSAHMSLLEGAQLSRAQVHFFEHNDPEDLTRVLREIADTSRSTRVLVCTEGVFSADGDKGRLRAIVDVCKQYGAMSLVDEAHSVLVAGAGGRGVCEEAGVLADVDLIVLTFSKGFGGVGGAVVAPRELARYIKWYARCRMFSCAIDPAVTGGILRGLQLGRGPDGEARRARIAENAAHLQARLRDQVEIGPTESWIVPVIYYAEEKTLPILDFLQRNGVDGSALQFPAVPINQSRVRLFVSSEHTRADLDHVADVVIQAAKTFGFTKSET